MNNKKPIIFLGGYLNIKRFFDFATDCGYQVAGIVDDRHFNPHLSKTLQGISIIDSPDNFFADPTVREKYQFFVSAPYDEPSLIESTTNTKIEWNRQRYIDTVINLDLDCVTLVAPTAQIADTAVLGKGAYIAGNCVIANYTKVGDFSQIHDNSVIGNHCTIGSNTLIQRLVTFVAHTLVGNNCIVGLHTLVADDYITIGDGAILHSGFVIARDIEPGELVHMAGRTFKKIYKMHRTID